MKSHSRVPDRHEFGGIPFTPVRLPQVSVVDAVGVLPAFPPPVPEFREFHRHPRPPQLPDLRASVLPGCALTLDRRLTSPGATPTQEEKLLLHKDPILVVLPGDTSVPGSPKDHSLWHPRWLSSLPSLIAHSLNSQLPEAPPKSWSPALLPGEPKSNAWFHYKKRRIRTHTHTHTGRTVT